MASERLSSDRLAGKTAVVTAAGSGIGRASAELFARAGARVFAADVNAAALKDVAGCEGHALDVRDPAAIAGFAKRNGPVNVLFNCAGSVPGGTVLDVDPAQWDAAFDLNVKSMYHMIRAFLPGMIAARGGSIINMSSVAGSITGVPDRCVYGATNCVQKFRATFRGTHVVARPAAADPQHATALVAHQRRGARLAAIDSQE